MSLLREVLEEASCGKKRRSNKYRQRSFYYAPDIKPGVGGQINWLNWQPADSLVQVFGRTSNGQNTDQQGVDHRFNPAVVNQSMSSN